MYLVLNQIKPEKLLSDIRNEILNYLSSKKNVLLPRFQYKKKQYKKNSD